MMLFFLLASLDADRMGVVNGKPLCRLARRKDPSRDRPFEIPFLDPGVEAHAFTFG